MFKKTFKIAIALSVVFSLSFLAGSLNKNQKAQVSSSIPATTFSIFNRNETVLEAQTILKDLEFYNGNLSGLFGFKTKNAILDYQRSISIPNTGILDIETQNRLFGVSTQIEYAIVDNTEYGNEFLYEWIYFNYRSVNDLVKIRGSLSEIIEFQDRVEVYENYITTSEGNEYKVKNISDNSLANFIDKNVELSGYFVGGDNSGQEKIFFINHVNEDSLNERFKLVPYSLDGNERIFKYIKSEYEESGEYVDIQGHFLPIDEEIVYGINDYNENVLLVGYDQIYIIENMSDFNMEKLLWEPATVRGFMLKRENEKGHRTIVINYSE